MESVTQIKEALSARSRTATIDELKSEGKKRVRLIKAEHVAAMVAEAVHAAVQQSGLVAPDEVERLVEKSREEFKAVLQERQQEAQHARDVEAALAAREHELAAAREQLQAAEQALTAAREELAALQAAPAAAPATPAAAPTAGLPNDLLLSLVKEMTTLKAEMLQAKAPPASAAATPAAGGVDLAAALDKLTGSLNERLEKMGQKMGISAAVGGDVPVDFGGLFKDADRGLESNMANIEVKQKAGGGIAANLAKLKKLKGGS